MTAGRHRAGRGRADDLPEEVLTAEESAVAREALVGERTPTVGALDALGVPDAVEDIEQEPVEDRAVAAGAQQQHPAAAAGDRCALAGARARRVDGRHGRVANSAAARLHSTTDRPRTSPAARFIPTSTRSIIIFIHWN